MSIPFQSQNPPTLAITPPLAVADGGTGGASATAAQTNLAVPSVLTQRMSIGPFNRINVAANLTDNQIELAGQTTLGALAAGWVSARDGSITAIATMLSAAAAGDTLTVTVFLNGVATAAVQAMTVGAVSRSTAFVAGTIPYAIADTIDVRITTPAGWTATTADLTVWFEVEG